MKYLILLIVILTSAWMQKIFQSGPFLFVSLIILSGLLLEVFSKTADKKRLSAAIILFVVSTSLITSHSIDESLFKATPEEQYQINQRRSYYPDNLGRFFQNKVTFSIAKIEGNLFYNLDPNLYFFASHPRERARFAEFTKYPPIFLPFFVIGLIWLVKQKSKPAFAYFAAALILSAFSRSTYDLGPLLLYPFMNSTIALGSVKLWRLIKK